MAIEKICKEDFDELKNWQANTSDKSYNLVKTGFTELVLKMNDALLTEKKRYNAELDRITKIHENNLNEIKTAFKDDPNTAIQDDFSTSIAKINSLWSDNISGAKPTVDGKINAVSFKYKTGTVTDKLYASIKENKDKRILDDFSSRKKLLDEEANKVDEFIVTVVESIKALKEAKIEANNNLFSYLEKKEKNNFKNMHDKLGRDYEEFKQTIVDNFEIAFNTYFSNEAFNSNRRSALNRNRTAEGYTCTANVPQHLFLGKRIFEVKLSENAEFMPEVTTLLRKCYSNKNSGITINETSIKVELFYCRSLDEGYSVFVECSNPETTQNKDIIKAYILKMLMNFPVGQTRPLLLDNDSSSAMTMFATIGESSGKGIVTRPWYAEEDIEGELKKVATERSNLSISYGEDVVSRLQRELIYLVAGRNFPKGFTQNAISQMSNIFLAGSKNGFFGIVQANANELKTKEEDPAFLSLTKTIKNNSLHVFERDGKFLIQDENNIQDEFVFDMMENEISKSKEIISVIINGVSNYKRQTENFEYLFSKDAGNVEGTDANNPSTWYTGNASSRFEVPIGISGANTVQKFVINSDGVEQHALISGVTGSGKSSLLRTIIASSMMKYSPDNVNLYLLDFKEGVEFAAFSKYRLPWVKMIALNTEREFALTVLRNLEAEFKNRAAEMKKNDASGIGAIDGKKFPRLILVFDEIQELLNKSDKITDECISILSTLVSEGRAMNMNVIIASQDFTHCNGIDRLKANMVIRIAFKGSPDSAKSIMGEDFSIVQLEQGDSGYAAINSASGARGKTNFFQCGYLKTKDRDQLLAKMAATMKHKECNTRVMSRNASQDRDNKFNRLICNNKIDYSNSEHEQYNLMIGDAFTIGQNKPIYLSTKRGENLLVVGPDEKVAKSIFSLSILSVLYCEIANKAKRIDNELIRMIDLSDEDDPYYKYFQYLKSQFTNQFPNLAQFEEIQDMIEQTYENLQDRISGKVDKSERLFFMMFGIDAAMILRDDMYEMTEDDNLTISQKLNKIIQDGPENGINCVIWASSLKRLRKILDNSTISRYFYKRIFFGNEKNDCEELIDEDLTPGVEACEAIFFKDINKKKAVSFRPYEIPEKDWVASIADSYKTFEKQ